MTFLAIIHSRASSGIDAPPVTVEVHLSNGLPSFSMVGLPDKAVKESKDRVRSALMNAQFEFPVKRITVNLAPADLPKDGGRFDLPIALGILAASKQIPQHELDHYEFAGELGLTGELRPIRGILPFALAASRSDRTLIIPKDNADEAALAKGLTVLPAGHLLDVCSHLVGREPLQPHQCDLSHVSPAPVNDLSEVKGQENGRRGLEIAAAGGHSLLMMGPPGTGKTMLASRLPGILPPMTELEGMESAAIGSVSGVSFDFSRWRQRPFRSPHHTASGVALVGGGSPPRPGEISLAHHGVLFLDELPEFNRHVLETLREPLESGQITISRAARQAEFPAKFQLVAAMNPCPCGFLGDPKGDCHCTSEQVARYRAKLSGPLLDRIDLHIEIPSLPGGVLSSQNTKPIEASETVRARVLAARDRQLYRQDKPNAALNNKEIEQFCQLEPDEEKLLDQAMATLHLSARAYHRILRVARTIADLGNEDKIQRNHLSEAINYRRLERLM